MDDDALAELLNAQAEVHAQVEGERYTFRNHHHTAPPTVQPDDAFAIQLVAVAGYDRDWACFMGPAEWSKERVVTGGDKVPEEHAAAFKYLMQRRHYRGY